MRALDASFLPPSLRDWDAFEAFFERRIKPDAVSAGYAVHVATADALEELSESTCNDEGFHREVCQPFRYDEKTITKSAASARTKLWRDHAAGRRASFDDEDSVEEALRSFGDLARFRVVFTLLADVDRALDRLLSQRAEHGLYLGRFEVVRFKDFVLDRATTPGRGHRARQFTVRADEATDRPVMVEIQFMTLLQHAWDRRNHPIYEHTRAGEELPPSVGLIDFAMSETLYLLDRHADDAWREFLEHRWRTGTRGGTP